MLRNDKLLEKNESIQPSYRNVDLSEIRYLFNRFFPYILIIIVVALRFTVAFAGAEPDYYTVDVVNPHEDIDLGNISVEVIDYDNNTDSNKITYHIDPSYNEMELINDLKIPLNNSCEYYTVSWNIYSYIE